MNGLFDSVHQACLATFGIPVTLKRPGGDVALSGIVEELPADEPLAGALMPDRYYRLTLLSSTAQTHSLTQYDTLLINGGVYQVITYQDDIHGLRQLTLRAYV